MAMLVKLSCYEGKSVISLLDSIRSTGNGKILFRNQFDYNTLEGESISTLKEMLKSPKHYRHRKSFQKATTVSMSMGTTSHVAVLEPERFLEEYSIWKGTDKDGKKQVRNGKKWDEFQEQNAGKIIIKDDEYKAAISLRDAVRRDDVAMKYLAMGEPEIALQWNDPDTDILCRGRADWITRVDGELCLVDLKTTRDASPIMFGRDVAKMSYHLQAAFYADAVEQATGESPRFIIVAVENYPPFDVVTYEVCEDTLAIGRLAYGELLTKLKECRASNNWPGQGAQMERTLILPDWCTPDEENDDMSGLDWEGKEAA